MVLRELFVKLCGVTPIAGSHTFTTVHNAFVVEFVFGRQLRAGERYFVEDAVRDAGGTLSAAQEITWPPPSPPSSEGERSDEDPQQ